jgi:hypothetical protein
MPKYTIDFGPDGEKLLQSLADNKKSTKAKVIRDALVIYSYLIKEVQKGNMVSITNGDEIKKDVVI